MNAKTPRVVFEQRKRVAKYQEQQHKEGKKKEKEKKKLGFYLPKGAK